jgi:hypothetical protein
MRRNYTLLCAGLLTAHNTSSLVAVFLVLFLSLGCATSRPRVVEVSAKRYARNVARPGEAYFVSWRPSTISMVKFEYRQVHAPNKIFERRCTDATRPCATFEIRGPAFASGGPVSAWRVSLWTDDSTCVAEQKSALW